MHPVSPKCTPIFRNAQTLQKMHPAFWEMHPEKRKMNPPIFPGCIFLLKLVRKPISNKIIKIASRTVHFSLIFRAFSTCQFYGTKAKLLKTEEEKKDRSPYIDRSLSFFAAIFGLKLRWRKISKKRVYQCFLHSFRLDSIPAPWYNTAVRNLFLGLNQNIL